MTPRAIAQTRGLKRAALFALSATVAASACGEEDDGKDNTQQPSMSGTASASVSASMSMSGTSTVPGGDLTSVQPVYGAPIGVGGAGNDDGSGDGNGGNGGTLDMTDPGGVGVALYGAPIAPEATE